MNWRHTHKCKAFLTLTELCICIGMNPYTHTHTKTSQGMRTNPPFFFMLLLQHKGACIPLDPLTSHSYFAATVTGWSISGCWRGAVSTASGTSRFAPSTAWWTSTEPTASPWRKWSASGTLPHPRAYCFTSPDTILIPTLIKAALKSLSPQPTSTLTPLT